MDAHSCAVYTLYSTLGAVASKSKLNSRSKRSLTTSICKRPKNPTLKPKPSATEFSGSQTNAGSFNESLSSASFRGSYWSLSIGKIPVKTIGFTSLYPSIGSTFLASIDVIVSPKLISITF